MLIQITAGVMLNNVYWHVVYRRRCQSHNHAERLAIRDLNMIPDVQAVSVHATKWTQAWDTGNIPGDIVNGRGSINLIALPEENSGVYLGTRITFGDIITSEPLTITDRDVEAEQIRNRLGDITFETV